MKKKEFWKVPFNSYISIGHLGKIHSLPTLTLVLANQMLTVCILGDDVWHLKDWKKPELYNEKLACAVWIGDKQHLHWLQKKNVSLSGLVGWPWEK